MVYLSDDFVNSYSEIEPQWGEIGAMVAARTYCHYLPEKGRREYWHEVVRRVVEYSCSLGAIEGGEAEELFDAIFNLRVFPAGRTLWVGGRDVVKQHGSANFNCTFRAVDDLDAFSEVFYWLLLGAGAGFSVERKYIDKLPFLHPPVKVVHEPYARRVASGEGEHTQWIVERKDSSFPTFHIVVGDSKEGWRDALKGLFVAMQREPVKLVINYDYVRPAGEPLKTFGGRASGYEALKDLFERILGLIADRQSKSGEAVRLRPVDAMDIMNCIGASVVVGGVRRTAEIALGDADDEEYVECKNGLFTDPAKAKYRGTRVMSNNSVMLYENPGAQFFCDLLEKCEQGNDMGVINAETAAKRCEGFQGSNPLSVAA